MVHQLSMARDDVESRDEGLLVYVRVEQEAAVVVGSGRRASGEYAVRSPRSTNRSPSRNGAGAGVVRSAERPESSRAAAAAHPAHARNACFTSRV